MRLELFSAANFIIHLIKLARCDIDESELQKFRLVLVEVMRRRYRYYWYPDKPFKGSGSRCIRINDKIDPVIAQAGEICNLTKELIRPAFPSDFWMWINPLEVTYSFGGHGLVCVLYEYKEGITEPWKPRIHPRLSGRAEKWPTPIKYDPTRTHIPMEYFARGPCKNALRKMNCLLDPRKSIQLEQLCAYTLI